MTRRELILASANDLARDFLYYDRKEDEELARGEIQEAVEKGEVTKEEIIEEFKKQLDEWW
jgi:ornithine cyclodeaminase/alanine dehydrogenase-like protein (mu-crystallin family)